MKKNLSGKVLEVGDLNNGDNDSTDGDCLCEGGLLHNHRLFLIY